MTRVESIAKKPQKVASLKMEVAIVEQELRQSRKTNVYLAVGIYVGYLLGICVGAAAVSAQNNRRNSATVPGGKLMYVVDVNPE